MVGAKVKPQNLLIRRKSIKLLCLLAQSASSRRGNAALLQCNEKWLPGLKWREKRKKVKPYRKHQPINHISKRKDGKRTKHFSTTSFALYTNDFFPVVREMLLPQRNISCWSFFCIYRIFCCNAIPLHSPFCAPEWKVFSTNHFTQFTDVNSKKMKIFMFEALFVSFLFVRHKLVSSLQSRRESHFSTQNRSKWNIRFFSQFFFSLFCLIFRRNIIKRSV